MIVSVDELATYMDQSQLSNRQEAAAELVLAGLQAELEGILRRPLEVVEEVELHTIPEDYLNGRSFYSGLSDSFVPFDVPPYVLPLRNSPVIEVTLVRFKPAPSLGTENPWYEMSPSIDYMVRTWGLDLYRSGANDIVEVTYTGGLVGADNAFLRLSILRAAAREMTNQVDDVVGLKDLTTNDVRMIQTGFTVEEIAVLKRFKRKQPAG
jgi:hypothetical protein